MVVVYRGSGAVWEVVRVIGGASGLFDPQAVPRDGHKLYGLRFSADGSVICVVDCLNHRASVFRVGDGGFVRRMATGLRYPCDVEEVEGGWLLACGVPSHSVVFVGDGVGGDVGGRPSLVKAGGGCGTGDGAFFGPSALAVVPGVGLVVREATNCRLQVFATPDAIAMAAMSPVRVAWMGVVARGGVLRCRV